MYNTEDYDTDTLGLCNDEDPGWYDKEYSGFYSEDGFK